MKNRPGISWGPDLRINLLRSSAGWLAVYYDSELSSPEIIRIFQPKSTFDYHQMMQSLAFYNYHTCRLCPVVKADIDATS